MINEFKVNWLINKISDGNVQGCLDIVLQPCIDIVDSRCVGAEVLIRGTYGNEMINPEEFISLSEANGSVLNIDLFSLREGVQFICDNDLLQQSHFRFSFNFSPYSFNLPDFASLICKEIDQKIAHHIILEITESNIPLNNYAIRNALRLREYGFLIAWDDVDSLNYALRTLQYFRFDFAKLDKNLLTNSKISLIKNLINVFHNFNTEIIVEGLEEQEQLSMLREMNVRYVQGFLFSPPVSKIDFIHSYSEKLVVK
ncbi:MULTISPECIES: EAL domain-containing protein [unclassified Leclercia]|uniref:EAL domain-containing protein n=1 Tax=Leclercia barmai TaxID=2785629 RepID=A0ABS7S082_9ENTR|nr:MULTISPECIES: EAL domain-containing protein [unclassified Leclercia]MBZ0059528.1 EAL domain-containing protein [Leclercia sp. EMC7]MCM5697338.1 EAL domain-containing protein [Leclercia sp. LTM01]MCM5702065.1 EAL domain-containing protein [Leclercia sp. LTM14]